MEIKIERPFELKLDVIATDEHVPSMKADVLVQIQQSGNSLEYRGSLWFECACWEKFVSNLSGIDQSPARLTDMGGCFVLALGTCSEKPEISWEMKKIAMDGAVATATCRFPADLDTLAHVKRQFTEFLPW
jgi:hypothetical protein